MRLTSWFRVFFRPFSVLPSYGPTVLLLAVCLIPSRAHAQAAWQDLTTGTDYELYARALAVRGLLPREDWSTRPFSPSVLAEWSTAPIAVNPWKSRLPRLAGAGDYFTLLRPSIEVTDNSAYAWGFNDGPAWQGRGVSSWATFGAAWRWGPLSMRLEPMAEYAQNSAFRLQVPVDGPGVNPYVDGLDWNGIDLPQRFGNSPYHFVNPGQSYVRLDVRGVGVGLSTENIFWGPGVHNALLFGPNASGFPHIFFGTNRALRTLIGRLNAQVIYGRLEQSAWAPPSPNASRLGAGLIATWQPPSGFMTLGFARFYHRDWPAHFSSADYTLPFGSLFSRRGAAGIGTADNQLLSLFFSVRAPNAGLELFGEFGKNDRNVDIRDATLEPEHNSAWLLGFLKDIHLDADHTAFWTIRAEVASGRVSAIQQIGRGQSTFYDHFPIAQGHTELGQLLGTPLIQRSGGVDAAVDRWSPRGRFGVSLFERQMPADFGVGMPANDARSQWDLGIGGTVFLGRTDLTFQAGHVWDLNRFPGQDVGNSYLRLGTRLGLPR